MDDAQNAANMAELARVLDLEPLGGPGPGGEAHAFRAWNQPKPGGRLFGGQVLSQCVMATSATVDDDRPIHSFHGYFLRAGHDDVELLLGVEDLRDGGSFTTRRVQAYQDGTPIFSGIASFQLRQSGLEHHDEMPAGVPRPEDVAPLQDMLAASDNPHVAGWVLKRPFDIRPIGGEIHSHFHGPQAPDQRFWLRAATAFPTDPVRNAAAAAYASDYSLLEPTLRAHGLSWSDARLRMASLDHAMWWHAPIDFNDWLLFDYRSPAAENGRGLGIGRIFSRDGRLLASVAQQGMVRVKE
ncbi:acyl-CoA thioesterase II [Brevibacterium sp. 5221]|uniref:Acyl-CoA thioesterase II n=1 Tax=Brevibacterium rongguiense TaxID=2695267 RepID=A0A6N9H750_9MICO|nr:MULTISPECIES: acyl-CoA thioesterase domain-containing protein [Brevibacterium]MYM19586.1 acyl-CoA thioesterase II [Brevibacterium rongguiense]WAL40572.1 thioesterase family protein [Brevibacterium sp. BRM-1]